VALVACLACLRAGGPVSSGRPVAGCVIRSWQRLLVRRSFESTNGISVCAKFWNSYRFVDTHNSGILDLVGNVASRRELADQRLLATCSVRFGAGGITTCMRNGYFGAIVVSGTATVIRGDALSLVWLRKARLRRRDGAGPGSVGTLLPRPAARVLCRAACNIHHLRGPFKVANGSGLSGPNGLTTGGLASKGRSATMSLMHGLDCRLRYFAADSFSVSAASLADNRSGSGWFVLPTRVCVVHPCFQLFYSLALPAGSCKLITLEAHG